MTVTALPLPAAPAAPMPAAPVPAPIYQPAPAGAPADAPRVFAAIAAVMRDVMPVAKDKENQQQRYKFRGVDDAMSAMAGPMRAHGLFILPSIAAHRAERRGEKMTHVNITMRYHVYGPAGDCLTAEVPGEASDFADKATNKAQSAALKYLLFTLFMIPVDGRSIDDGDRDHPVEPPAEHRAERQQRTQQRQQRNPRGQQPRRSHRAEPAPWEQAPQPSRRDYLAEAMQAPSREAFDAIRAAAVKAGAPADYLDRLDAVARQREQAVTNNPHRHRDPEQGDHRETPAEQEAAVLANVERTRAEAENRLRLAASRANLPTLDADFERAFGKTIAEAPAVTLDAFRKQIEAAAGGGQ
ncbi:ERF family protein [Streptomyces sp. NPDC006476]|uniref:ERF family protein n=1 Tax=Streptomyces sp. NPDC006476 TaxID=3157175 RepID=UPI0033BAFA2C